MDLHEMGLRKLTREEAIIRVGEIDKMFADATGWGSWMVSCANEREALADEFNLTHNYQARTSSGGRTD